AKDVVEVQLAPRMGQIVAQAFATACCGTPGPVIVVLPEDVLAEPCATGAPDPLGASHPAPGQNALDEVAMRLSHAQRPVLVVGSESRGAEFRAALQQFSEKWQLPVAVTNKNQDLFSNTHPHWLGHLGFFVNPSVSAVLAQADLVLAVGSRLGDTTSQGFTFPRQNDNPQTLVHVYPDASALATQHRTAQAIVAGADAFVQAMNGRAVPTLPSRKQWLAITANARDLAHGWDADQTPEADVFGHVTQAIAAGLTPDAIVTLDAGNFSTWVHRIVRMQPSQTMLAAACGAMGIGVPAALAASLRHRNRQVLAFCGDGGFLMTGNELATAVGRQLPLKIVVANNSSYGTIRSYQERQFPGRVHGTVLHNPDFTALAKAYGAAGYRVTDAAQANDTVRRFLAEPGPALLEVVCDIEQIMAGTTLSRLRA
ncbi:MAG: thiamine pyrophosphate-dependent enzyme, partial [Betaproteobacteria bacterium]